MCDGNYRGDLTFPDWFIYFLLASVALVSAKSLGGDPMATGAKPKAH